MRAVRATVLAALLTLALAAPAAATPVCTDGYKGGPPASLCGGRIFPEAELARGVRAVHAGPVRLHRVPARHRVPRAEVPALDLGLHAVATSTATTRSAPGPTGMRSYEEGDAGDGRDIQVIKITDHQVPDEGKETLLFSLSVHGNERGGLEGGLRTAEDLAIAAEDGGKLVDGVDNYESSTGREPKFHEYDVARRCWRRRPSTSSTSTSTAGRSATSGTRRRRRTYTRGNSHRHRPQPPDADASGGSTRAATRSRRARCSYGTQFMHDVAERGPGRQDGLRRRHPRRDQLAGLHGHHVPGGRVRLRRPPPPDGDRRAHEVGDRRDAVRGHRRGDRERDAAATTPSTRAAIPLKPAHWATVWDTLGYTDTGFIGDYMATDLGVTGMDYEIIFNHTVPEKIWNVYLQENHINASRGIIKTAMAYALFPGEGVQREERQGRADRTGRLRRRTPTRVTDTDENGPGTLPGPEKDGIGEDGKPVEQRSYSVTNQKWFRDTNALMDRSVQEAPRRGRRARRGAR